MSPTDSPDPPERRESPPGVAPSLSDTPVQARNGAFAAEYGSLETVGSWIHDLSRAAGLDEGTAGEIELAVGEATTNIIKHGLGKDPEARFHFFGWAWPGTVEVLLVDSGPAFDPTSAPPPPLDLPLEERPVGGLGIHMMKNFMDDVKWRRVEGRNHLRLRRSTAPPP